MMCAPMMMKAVSRLSGVSAPSRLEGAAACLPPKKEALGSARHPKRYVAAENEDRSFRSRRGKARVLYSAPASIFTDERMKASFSPQGKNAQQGARANGTTCHDSCRARNRASSCRGSSLTFGKKPASGVPNIESMDLQVKFADASAAATLLLYPADESVKEAWSSLLVRHAQLLQIVGLLPHFIVGVIRTPFATQSNVGWVPYQEEPNKAPEPTPRPVTIPAEPGIAPGRVVAHL